MTRVVLDASAVAAVLREEPGHENVLPHLRGSMISAVNLAEVYCSLEKLGAKPEFTSIAIQEMKLECVPFDEQQARILASIYKQTQGSSVGIADRVCMTLGLVQELPVLTGDHAWLDHDVGVEVRLFRNHAE